jgi:hypothetical protein
VFDENTRGQFDGTRGFVAEMFSEWRQPIPEPMSRDDRYFELIANKHLSTNSQCASFYMSVATVRFWTPICNNTCTNSFYRA